MLGGSSLAGQDMIAHGADHQCFLACTRCVHVERRSLHLVRQHTHLRPVRLALVLAIEDISGEDVAYVVFVPAFLGGFYRLAA